MNIGGFKNLLVNIPPFQKIFADGPITITWHLEKRAAGSVTEGTDKMVPMIQRLSMGFHPVLFWGGKSFLSRVHCTPVKSVS